MRGPALGRHDVCRALFGRLWVVAAAVLATQLLAVPAAARTLSIDPGAVTVAPGASFTIQVDLDEASGVAGFQFDLVYSGTLISHAGGTSPRAGGLLAGRGWTLLHNQVDANTLRVLAYSPSLAPLTGSGTLVELDFQAGASPGSTPIELQRYILSDPTGTALLPLDAVGSSVTVRKSLQPPVAAFTFTPSSPTDREVVTFTDTSSDPDGTVVAWAWGFGDGASATTRNPTHQFPDNGTYTVTLTVTDNDNLTNTTSHQVAVRNIPPTAAFSYTPAQPTTQNTVVFTSAATDSDGTVTAWAWTFGDGGSSTQQNPTHRYTENGSYTVTLTVTDNDGATASVSHTVTVANVPPTANFTFSPTTPMVGQTVAFTDTSSDPDGTVVAWQWSFGDGSSSALRNPTHIYAAAGTYQVSLTVTDNDGSTGNRTQAITVQACGCQITLSLTAPVRVNAGRSGSLQVTLTNTGTSGDTVTVVVKRMLPLPETTLDTRSLSLATGKKAKASYSFSYTFRTADRPQVTFRATATTGCGKVTTAQAVSQVK